MNTIATIQAGLTGENQGIPFGDPRLDELLGGIQKATLYTIAAESKCGKSSFANYFFLLKPYLHDPMAPVYWSYYSTEISRIRFEVNLISSYIFLRWQLRLSPRYILGKEKHANGDPKLLAPEHFELVARSYEELIIPLMGEYDNRDNLIKPGKVTFTRRRENPTGVWNTMIKSLASRGEFQYEQLGPTQVITGYIPNDEKQFEILMVDHVRGIATESGMDVKQKVDKLYSYCVDLRDLARVTTIAISHTNRTSTDVQKLRLMGEFVYPDMDTLKDTGAGAEDSDLLISLFNPKDPKYGLTRHFGRNLAPLPNTYRTMHIPASRDTEAGDPIGFNFEADVKTFTQI